MSQSIYALRINRIELNEILEKAILLTPKEKEVFLDEWEWQEGKLDWRLMGMRASGDFIDWLKCVKSLMLKRNHDLLLDIFKLISPLHFDSHEMFDFAFLAPLELDSFVWERENIISIKNGLELLLEDNTIKTIEISHRLGGGETVLEWEMVNYYLKELLDFVQQCGPEDVAIIYII